MGSCRQDVDWAGAVVGKDPGWCSRWWEEWRKEHHSSTSNQIGGTVAFTSVDNMK